MTKFMNMGYPVYYNGRSKAKTWFVEQLPSDLRHRVVWLDGKYGVKAGVENDFPAWCIFFNEDLNEDEWLCVMQFLTYPLCDEETLDAAKAFLDPVTTHTNEYTPEGEKKLVDGKMSTVNSIAPEPYKYGEGYHFSYKYIQANDTMYYQVKRPNTADPFVVAVSCFEDLGNMGARKKDHSWFFTDIYGSSSWDVNRLDCKYDFTFLLKLWKHFNLPGEFNMEVVKRRIDACDPKKCTDQLPQLEPRVFRREMEAVIANDLRRLQPTEDNFIKKLKTS